MMEPIILASTSPQRQEFLRLLGLPFSCISPPIDENYDSGAEPESVAKELAIRKVKSIVEMLGKKSPPPSPFSLWVCGADTLISMGGKIYGKPMDRKDAEQMLMALEGRDHEVITAVALYNGRAKTMDCRSVISTISFAPMIRGEIEWYLDSGEWKDAAGSYKIQGLASCFITAIKGSYSSIVGLPLREFYVMLKDNGYQFGG